MALSISPALTHGALNAAIVAAGGTATGTEPRYRIHHVEVSHPCSNHGAELPVRCGSHYGPSSSVYVCSTAHCARYWWLNRREILGTAIEGSDHTEAPPSPNRNSASWLQSRRLARRAARLNASAIEQLFECSQAHCARNWWRNRRKVVRTATENSVRTDAL